MTDVQVDLSVLGAKVGRTVFRDINNPDRWELTKVPGFMEDRSPDAMSQLEVLGFETGKKDKFEFKMTDFETDEVVFDSIDRSLIMTDKYLEIGFRLPSTILFGLGQHNAKFLLKEGNWTMWNRDRNGSPVATGQGNNQTYGTHPFLMCKTKNNKFIGMLFYNSNAQEVNIRFAKDDKSIITYRTVGGILDIYYFMAGSADEVIKNYNNLIGRPILPPFWGLGYHQSSWEYNNTNDLKEVVKRYAEDEFLLETMWVDIPYMHEYIDFSVNKTSFGDLGKFVKELHGKNMHFVPIIDAGISIKTAGDTANWYEIGKKRNVFIKSCRNPDLFGGSIVGSVWPKHAVFVDFFNPNATDYWKEGLNHLHDIVPFDGVWLDMNEASNSCKDENDEYIGECPPEDPDNFNDIVKRRLSNYNVEDFPVPPESYDYIPYSPDKEPLYKRTLSLDSYHYDKNRGKNYIQYNTHSLFATQETMATSEFLQGKEGRKPFIISRASFVGHGQFGSVWTGDNEATEQDLKLSINQVMLFNIFGIPFTGGDICGFHQNTTPELCARWIQVGAFYPFMRNHYAHMKNPQELYLFEEPYKSGMRTSLKQRYSLLRYMYTLLYESSENGTPTVRHLMYDNPEIDKMVENEDSFMLGKGIRISANFDTSKELSPFKTYFPQGRWLDYNTYEMIEVKEVVSEIELYNGWDYTNIHVRAGSIIPFQDTSQYKTETIEDLVSDSINLLVVYDETGYSEGTVYAGKGEFVKEPGDYYKFSYHSGTLKIGCNY